MSESLTDWAYIAGRDRRDRCWILHPCDVWVRNPHFVGAETSHPESDE